MQFPLPYQFLLLILPSLISAQSPATSTSPTTNRPSCTTPAWTDGLSRISSSIKKLDTAVNGPVPQKTTGECGDDRRALVISAYLSIQAALVRAINSEASSLKLCKGAAQPCGNYHLAFRGVLVPAVQTLRKHVAARSSLLCCRSGGSSGLARGFFQPGYIAYVGSALDGYSAALTDAVTESCRTKFSTSYRVVATELSRLKTILSCTGGGGLPTIE